MVDGKTETILVTAAVGPWAQGSARTVQSPTGANK